MKYLTLLEASVALKIYPNPSAVILVEAGPSPQCAAHDMFASKCGTLMTTGKQVAPSYRLAIRLGNQFIHVILIIQGRSSIIIFEIASMVGN